MSENNNRGFGEDNRYEMRRRKRMNRILNGSILVVGALILFFALQLFLPGSEEASDEEQNDESTPDSEEEEIDTEDSTDQTAPKDNQETDNQSETVDTDNSPENTSDENTEEQDQQNEINSSDREEDNEDDQLSVPETEAEDGEWEPIGTEQSGSFSHDFDEDSQNWEEMEAALRYATDLSEEEMKVWQIENGGDVDKVIGTVSTLSNADQPLQVTMQFVENEGWKPLEVERLDSNPYRQ
ncbi:type IV secretory pathway VirB10-like protein [Salibacterium salarium]|uniref:YrrS family protein n=1 Tax=Salibacterium salarium TaxID=284579 RepID=UPI0027820C2A|nr:YrrS family protein [Salibacterium salarium]MDQ0299803.1 type IV secretory pathway VirB10-like protein [Salibacterium salarium]